MDKKIIKSKCKEVEIEFGKIKITGKGKHGSLVSNADIDFTIDGKPYADVIGPCESLTMEIKPGEPVMFNLKVWAK